MLKARVLPRTCEHELCCSRVDARARRRDTVKGRVRTQQNHNQTLCIGEFLGGFLRPSALAWPWACPAPMRWACLELSLKSQTQSNRRRIIIYPVYSRGAAGLSPRPPSSLPAVKVPKRERKSLPVRGQHLVHHRA